MVRMLRAVRFAVRLGFAIEPRTQEAIRELAGHVTRISGERIFDELGKMLATPQAPEALALLERLGLARALMAELFEADLWVQSCRRVELVAGAGEPVLTFAALLAGLAPKQIEAAARRWGASNEFRQGVCWLVGNLPRYQQAEEMELADFKPIVADARFVLLCRLWSAQERMATGSDPTVRRVLRRARAIPPGRLSPRPLVTGEVLKSLGLHEGPLLGRLLRHVYRAQLNEQVHTRAEAMDLARKWLAQSV